MNKSLTWILKQSLSVSILEPVCRPRSRCMKGRLVPLMEETQYIDKNLYWSSFFLSSSNGPMTFYQGNCIGKKQITGAFKYYWTVTLNCKVQRLWSTCQSKGLRGSGDAWNFSSGTSHSGSWTYPLLFPLFWMHNWNRYTQQLAESSHWFPDLWNKGYYSGMWKPLELSVHRKILNQKQYQIPGGIMEISATIKD